MPQVVLRSDLTSVELSKGMFGYFDDDLCRQTIESIIIHPDWQMASKPYFENKNVEHCYWYHLKIKNVSENELFYLVSHNYTINNIDVYVVDEDRKIKTYLFSNTTNLYQRNIRHKQPAFDLKLPTGNTYDLYIKIKNNYNFRYTFELFTPNYFGTFYFNEYLWYGIFYGMLFFVILYSFFTYLALGNRLLIAYIIFCISQLLFMIFRDGTCLYLFHAQTPFINIIENITLAMFSISLAGCCIAFMKLFRYKWLFKLMLLLCAIRVLLCLFLLKGLHHEVFHLDLLIMLVCLAGALYSMSKKDFYSRYMVLGLLALITTYIIYYLSVLGYTPIGAISFFAMYYGVVAESIFFTMALSEVIKQMRLEHYYTEVQKKELEIMVRERTATISRQNLLLKEKAKELNDFLYRASHDIKGPIKSIEGLCLLAVHEGPDTQGLYLKKIYDRSILLGKIVDDFNKVTTINASELLYSLINFNDLHMEVCNNLSDIIGYSNLNVDFKIEKNFPFYCDKNLLLSIYQNLFENAIKFQNPTNTPWLQITITSAKEGCTIGFHDNGIGIKKEYLQNVFDMFFKAHDTTGSTKGLGLYVARLSVQKLNGSISVESEEGEGSIFKLHFTPQHVLQSNESYSELK